MPRVILPPGLTRLASGEAEVDLEGATAGDALRRLEELHPDLRGWVLDEHGRLRRHVQVFVNEEQGALETELGPGDRVHVLQAISGGRQPADGAGAPDRADQEIELFVGTRKGLFVLRGRRGGALEIADRHFPGQVAEYARRDPRTGRVFASVTHGQFGPHLYYTDDLSAASSGQDGGWQEADGPAFPDDVDASVERTWVVVPGAEDGVLWAGVAPAALFRSGDGGASWQLVRSLWDHPRRGEWNPGFGGLCLHSICPWPGEPDRLAVAVSAGGVWVTDDGCSSWQQGGRGLVARYMPEEAREDTVILCVHKMERSPLRPERLYCQFHGGVYRSDDAGLTWTDLHTDSGLPADFGFPIVVDPRDPDRAWVIPLVADVDRVTPDGRLRVYETRDAGRSWEPRADGLPQEDTYLTLLRQAFCHDGRDPLGLYFGTTSGEVFASADRGVTWHSAANNLPPITSVRC